MAEKKCYNIILGNAPIINGNKGCLALTYSIIYILDQVFEQSQCDYKLFIRNSLDKDFDIHTLSIGKRSVSYQSFGYTLGKAHNTHPWWLFKALFWQTKINWQIWRQADFVLDIGEGDSFSDIYGIKRLNKENRIHVLARLFHKPYGFLPQTLGPFESVRAQRLAQRAFACSRFIMARDALSYKAVKDLVPHHINVNEYIDFALPYEAVRFDKGLCHVGINISALLWNGGYNRNNQFHLVEDYPIVIREIIDWFIQHSTVQVHLIAHVINPTGAIEDDYRICESLCHAYSSSRVVIAPAFATPIEAKNYIAGLDFFIGARMHSTIAAYSAHVPVVPMAYSRKFNGLYRDTLQYNHLVDLKQDSRKDILRTIQTAFEQREEIKASLLSQDIPSQRIELIVADLKKHLCPQC